MARAEAQPAVVGLGDGHAVGHRQVGLVQPGEFRRRARPRRTAPARCCARRPVRPAPRGSSRRSRAPTPAAAASSPEPGQAWPGSARAARPAAPSGRRRRSRGPGRRWPPRGCRRPRPCAAPRCPAPRSRRRNGRWSRRTPPSSPAPRPSRRAGPPSARPSCPPPRCPPRRRRTRPARPGSDRRACCHVASRLHTRTRYSFASAAEGGGVPADWDIAGRRGCGGVRGGRRLRGARGGRGGRPRAGARPVRRRRGHRAVRRGRVRRRRDAAAARGGRQRLGRGDVPLPADRGGRRGAGRHAPRILRRQRGDARLAGGPRRAVRGQPLPGQDVVPDQPPLPVLLGQRGVRAGYRAARAQRAPGPRPRHLGRAAVREAGGGRQAGRGRGRAADRGGAADHRRRAGDGGGVPLAARRAARGRGQRTAWCIGPRSSPTCTCRSSAGSCTGRRLAGAQVRANVAGRGGSRRGDRGGRLRCEPADAARPTRRPPAAACRWPRRATTAAASCSGPGPGERPPAWTGSRSGASSARRPRWCAACWSTADGKRICDESRYGAAIGDAIVRSGGQAWLLVDRATLAAGAQAGARLDALVPAAAGVVPAVRRAGDRGHRGRGRGSGRRRPRGLAATLAAYNTAATGGG